MPTVYITPETERIAVMLFISAVAHIFLIYAVGFIPPSPKSVSSPPIRIILVQSSTEKDPDDPNYFAQASQEGSGESEKDKTPSTPTIAPFPDEMPEIVAMPPPESSAMPLQEFDIERLAVHRPSTHQVQSRENVLSPEMVTGQGETLEETVTEISLTSTSMEIITKMASIQAETDAFEEARAKKPKKIYSHNLPPAKEGSFVRYMKAWQLRAERIGTAYYRQEAKRNPFSGALNVQVAINHDGTIHSVEVTRFLDQEQAPTRRQLLEEAVRRIVYLTAPFDPFPENIREEGDILYMTYHWGFKHGESVNFRNADL